MLNWMLSFIFLSILITRILCDLDECNKSFLNKYKYNQVSPYFVSSYVCNGIWTDNNVCVNSYSDFLSNVNNILYEISTVQMELMTQMSNAYPQLINSNFVQSYLPTFCGSPRFGNECIVAPMNYDSILYYVKNNYGLCLNEMLSFLFNLHCMMTTTKSNQYIVDNDIFIKEDKRSDYSVLQDWMIECIPFLRLNCQYILYFKSLLTDPKEIEEFQLFFPNTLISACSNQLVICYNNVINIKCEITFQKYYFSELFNAEGFVGQKKLLEYIYKYFDSPTPKININPKSDVMSLRMFSSGAPINSDNVDFSTVGFPSGYYIPATLLKVFLVILIFT